MHRNILGFALVFVIAAMTAPQANADVVTFDLAAADGSGIDGQGAGGTLSATSGATTVTLTSLSVTAPEFDANSMLTGATLAAQTNATGSGGGNFGVNNLTITNAAFNTATGAGGSESANFNYLESWTFEFDTDVTFKTFDFASLGANENFDLTVGGTTFQFFNGNTNDIFDDPTGDLFITAGTDITFTAVGSLETTNIRIDTIEVHVTAVPEPGSIAFLGLFAFATVVRRKR